MSCGLAPSMPMTQTGRLSWNPHLYGNGHPLLSLAHEQLPGLVALEGQAGGGSFDRRAWREDGVRNEDLGGAELGAMVPGKDQRGASA